MEIVAIVTLLALVQCTVFALQVGKARETYGIKAPATTGSPEFEAYHRVHQNTCEQLLLWLPALWISAYFLNAWLAAALGVGFIVGRQIYARAYVADPKTRGMGMMIGFVCTALLMLTGLVGAVISLLQ